MKLTDVSEFMAALASIDQHQVSEARGFFDSQQDTFITRAPGRLDLMGGIADYSGSLVLQYPIRQATLVALQCDSEPIIRIISLPNDGGERAAACEVSLSDLNGLDEYSAARDYFRQDSARSWAAYVAGVFLVLMRERGVRFDGGARILISSSVPEGKGVSSSAALEVSVMQAVSAAFDLRLEARELALLCQRVENQVVGAPCGVMDQMVSSCGEEHRLLALLCQPAELLGLIQLPEEIAVWGIDSGIRHSVAGADYGSVRAGAFIGYRMIAELAGLKAEPVADKLVRIDDPKWHGYLANLTPAEFETVAIPFLSTKRHEENTKEDKDGFALLRASSCGLVEEQFRSLAEQLPETINSAEFLARFHGVTDEVSVIHPDREYAVRAPTAHPIYENHRVNEFAELLRQPVSETQLQALGELMYRSHESYSACGLGSAGTDELVRLVKAEQGSDLYGAKITGGGSGGTVAVLGRRGSDAAIQSIAQKYKKITGHSPMIFSGSSPGSAQFGNLRVSL